MKISIPYILAVAIALWSGGLSCLFAADAKVPRGGYTGAGQVMIIGGDKEIRYTDNLGICHIRIAEDGSLEAHFPGEKQPTHLQITETETRMVWKAVKGDKIFRATAMPFSAELYAFRLEILRDGEVIGGAQQFYALGRKSAVEPLSGAAPKR